MCADTAQILVLLLDAIGPHIDHLCMQSWRGRTCIGHALVGTWTPYQCLGSTAHVAFQINAEEITIVWPSPVLRTKANWWRWVFASIEIQLVQPMPKKDCAANALAQQFVFVYMLTTCKMQFT